MGQAVLEERVPSPSAVAVGGVLIALFGGILLYSIGHRPQPFGLVVGAPFGLAMYAAIVVGDTARTTSQRIAPVGVIVLQTIAVILLDGVVSGSAAIAAGVVLVFVGALDSYERE